jgi:hypothetical protein
MLSHAATDMGYGWGLGVHEALDEFGALFGPLLVALVLAASQRDYQLAFAAGARGVPVLPASPRSTRRSRSSSSPTRQESRANVAS